MGNLTGRHKHAVIIVLYSGFLSLLFWDLQRLIMILFVPSGMCPVSHRDLFCLSLRPVIFRLQSWHAHDIA